MLAKGSLAKGSLAKGRYGFHAIVRNLAVPADFGKALCCFRKIHRHPLVPVNFVVPIDEKWPVVCHGLKLGQTAAWYREQYRVDKLNTDDRQVLLGLGFTFHKNDWKWKHRVQSALLTYKEVHGDLEVPKLLVVPSSKPWPEETWGLTLGNTVRNIRVGDYLSDEKPERRRWLDEMGFVWDDPERDWEIAKSALRTYKEEYGDLEIPQAFIVPPSEPWAEETWGMQLGEAVGTICVHLSDKNPKRRRWLEGIGFQFRPPKRTE
jgi:hypothetical protein